MESQIILLDKENPKYCFGVVFGANYEATDVDFIFYCFDKTETSVRLFDKLSAEKNCHHKIIFDLIRESGAGVIEIKGDFYSFMNFIEILGGFIQKFSDFFELMKKSGIIIFDPQDETA